MSSHTYDTFRRRLKTQCFEQAFSSPIAAHTSAFDTVYYTVF